MSQAVVRMSTVRPLAVAAAAALLAVVPTACGSDDGGAAPGYAEADDTSTATYEFVIPAGAGEAIDRGEPLDILPAELEVTVGETIRIVNEDDRGHSVGPWFVGANEVVSQEFTRVGTFQGECTVHPSGQLVLVVAEA